MRKDLKWFKCPECKDDVYATREKICRTCYSREWERKKRARMKHG